VAQRGRRNEEGKHENKSVFIEFVLLNIKFKASSKETSEISKRYLIDYLNPI
jgi:hypothetical protein